ncbi:drug metabolite transporter superfamily [Lentinula edodes]|uniref:Drug metabolite transporter superfamily n=1 Tax=Lentinula edodes TaxID=5353 RepID=A0A1Q3EJG1_LENED|nr:drug metabolite transporter superfamily [Lentinula edodes]
MSSVVPDYALLPSDTHNDADDSSNDLGFDENNAEHTGKFAAFLAQLSNLFHRNVGLLLIVTAQAFLALVNVAVKKLNTIDPPVPTFELIFIRMATTYVFSIAYMKYTAVESPFLGPKGVRFLLMFRGFSGFFGVFGIYFSLKFLSLSDATVLTFLSPLCTAVAGAQTNFPLWTPRSKLGWDRPFNEFNQCFIRAYTWNEYKERHFFFKQHLERFTCNTDNSIAFCDTDPEIDSRWCISTWCIRINWCIYLHSCHRETRTRYGFSSSLKSVYSDFVLRFS